MPKRSPTIVEDASCSQIDALRCELERQWREKSVSCIEELLKQIPEEARPRGLSELIAAEVDLKRTAGEKVSIQDYLKRFPDHEPVVREAFALADRVPEHDSMEAPTRSYVSASESEPTQKLDTQKLDTPVETRHPSAPPRFRLERELGRGTYGVVYLATDTHLPRQVALKIPSGSRFESERERLDFIREAQHAARLQHPGIVTVYDVSSDGDQVCIVQEYMPGGDLKRRLQTGALSCQQSVAWMIPIAEAIAFAHQRDTFHRDLKPANILLDEREIPRVTDFGLALNEDEQPQHRYEFAGTLSYMSPEQVRYESHRLDGRSDTWSLGVILYEMLTGRRPFRGTEKELIDQIKHRDPRPLREINPELPAELERICLKCLAKRVTDRYSSASDLAQDLRNWQQSLNREAQDSASNVADAVRIVPKGLRAFDARDADFFLNLLPGPRDRDGIPESIRFWKVRIEETDPAATFAVGVLHGPSGCGKSSLLRAGLLTHLASHITTVLVEATPTDTELRLFNGLRRQLPQIPHELALPDVLAGIRAARWNPDRKKVLIVLDQFEQWLHAGNLGGPAQLVDALRHCDGEHLQCLLLVREDFWTGISRFMQRLEIPIQEERNSALVDRFDPIHARRVLAEFGRAFGRLPANLQDLSPSQEKFLDAAIEQLSEEGRVICVRLALFGDLIKGKPWTRDVLDQSGGAEGLGVTFLEDTFAAKSAPETHRRHEQAARKLFRKLLPEADSDIKGSMQSREALLEACGYGQRPAAFEELIRILDDQLRLVTPTAPEGDAEHETRKSGVASMPPRYYQLTHDYLVPSLRTWLTRKQAERARGRAELRLASVAADWGARPENKRLPTTWEYVSIRLLTKGVAWSPSERKVMRAAAWFHAKRWALALASVILLSAVTWGVISGQRERLASERNRNNRRQAELLVHAALDAPAAAAPYAAKNIEPLREHAVPYLQQRLDDNSIDPAQRFRAAVLLTQFGDCRVQYLVDGIESADRNECSNVVAALESCGESARGPLQKLLEQAESQNNLRLKARLALTLVQLGETATAEEMLALGPDPTERAALIDALPQWHGRVDRLVEKVLDSQSDAFRSGLLLGIGSATPEDLSASELDAVSQKLARCYREFAASGTHAAAEWAIRRWQLPLPAVDSSVNVSRDWRVNSVGIMMVKVPPTDWKSPTDPPSFWLSDREISRRVFQAFVDDPNWPATAKPVDWPGADPERSPSQDHPVQNVSWIDAVLLCNWLSNREGREASYVSDGMAWQLVAGANGYRLPTEAEWEFACRARTTTEFVSGNDERFLESYAVYRSNQTAICGSKMPNPWGLFDMHGNVYEWCQDWFFPNSERSLRSGAFDYSSSKSRSSNRQSNVETYRSFTIGIRIARSGD